MKRGKINKIIRPDRLWSYFKSEKAVLIIITVTGILYNIGMVAGPYFEGQLVQKLCDIINGVSTAESMAVLCAAYVAVILLVQTMRTFKRFYVRRFANNVNKNMRHMVYNSLVFYDRTKFDQESTGVMMTKAVSDVNACVEGMRKFTTEIFDTGVVLVAYFVMLMIYDVRLAIISCIFPPAAYIIAEKLKVVVYKYNKEYKKQTEVLSNMTNDRVSGAILYRIFGREKYKNDQYSKELKVYEKTAVKANVWENSMTPIYLVISSVSVIFILYFGSKNVCGQGWKQWNIAAFTTFLACFTKLAAKSSKAAKLFNAVQKANVSWKRIKPLMKDYMEIESDEKNINIDRVEVNNLSFRYPDGDMIIKGLDVTAVHGQIIGVTGPVAGGKSTFGKTFLYEYPYGGSIKFYDGIDETNNNDSEITCMELSEMSERQINSRVIYMGHNPELISTSIKENICLGDDVVDVSKWLSFVCLDEEVCKMQDGVDTLVGNGGMQLSGGQQARLALARTFAHAKPVIVLDDPFSALDKATEHTIMENIIKEFKDNIIIIISHRLEMFTTMDNIVWIDNGVSSTGTHEEFMKNNPDYRTLFELQKGGVEYDEK